MKWLYIILFLLVSAITFAQEENNNDYDLFTPEQVIIKGNAPEYSGQTLKIKFRNNYITRTDSTLAICVVDKNGNFSGSFYIDEITKITINLGKLEGYLYVEPGLNYTLILPPYYPLLPKDEVNPFFKRNKIMLGILSEDGIELNKKIRDFNDRYYEFFTKKVKDIVVARDRKECIKIMIDLDYEFPAEQGEWFFYYKHFMYQELYMYIYASYPLQAIKESFYDYPIMYNMDTYWASLIQMFSGFFYNYCKIKRGKTLKEALEKKPTFTNLVAALKTDSLFAKNNFAELVIMNSLYSDYYNNKRSKRQIINLFKEATKNTSGKNKKIAEGILSKITRLKPGNKDIKLLAFDIKTKDTIKLSNKNHKFTYLNFVETRNYACKTDFQMLKVINNEFKNTLNIVSIVMDTDLEKAGTYIENNELNWTFATPFSKIETKKYFNLKALPSYMLFDPEGKLILSPAPTPKEKFNNVFGRIINKYHREQQRKENSKPKNIFNMNNK